MLIDFAIKAATAGAYYYAIAMIFGAICWAVSEIRRKREERREREAEILRRQDPEVIAAEMLRWAANIRAAGRN